MIQKTLKKGALLLLILILIALWAVFVRAPHGVAVLAYHSISDEPFTDSENLFVRPAELEKQISLLSRLGYKFVFASEADPSLQEKQVCITLDDGYKDNLTGLLPILEKYGAKATIFVATKNLGMNEFFLSENDIKTLSESGLVEIGSHTDGHYLAKNLTDTEFEQQLSLSKKRLEEMTGKPVTTFSYPGGSFDSSKSALAAKYYEKSFTFNGTLELFRTGSRLSEIPRITVNRGTPPLRLLLCIVRAR